MLKIAGPLSMRHYSDPCTVKNAFGSHCTQLAFANTARVAACGRFHAGARCRDVGNVLYDFVLACQRDVGGGYRAGGYIRWGSGEVYKVAVYHT